MLSKSRRSFAKWRRLLGVEELEPRVVPSTFYVATSGNDQSAGSQQAPWATLQHAADSVKAGDTVIVEPGTYKGFVMGWNGPQNGTAAAPITFAAQSGVVINAPNSQTADGIDLEGCSYITLEGFTVTNPNSTISRAGIRAAGTSFGDVIENNSVTGAGEWGIFTAFANDVLILDNTTADSVNQHGIYVSNASVGPQIIGNTSFGNYGCGIHLNGDRSQGGSGLISGALIEGNIIYNNGAGGGSGINCDGVQNSTIINNLLYNNQASGISLFRIDGAAGSDNNVVANNTVLMPSNSRWALNIASASTGNTVFNNIFYDANTSHGSIEISANSLPGFVSDHNVLDGRESVNSGNTVLSLAQWQTKTGQDKHSLVSTPSALFVNPSGNNYQLSSTSPAIDAGTATLNGHPAPTTDLSGNVRPQGNGYDIGAYEYVSGSTGQTATHFAVSVPATATAGNSFTITVKALDANNNVVTNYTGTVHLSSTDLQAVLPADYTFNSTDGGSHTFTITKKTVGPRLITVTDKSTGSLTGQAIVYVTPATLSQLVLAGYPSSVKAGTSHLFTVSAEDAYGNLISGYLGSVHFTSSDPQAVLPADYTFKAANAGVHAFHATLNTTGTQSLTVTDTSNSKLTSTQGNITVT